MKIKIDQMRVERSQQNVNRPIVRKDRRNALAQQDIDEVNAMLRSIPPCNCPEDFQLAYVEPRKHPAHGVFLALDKPTIVYATICCKNRRPWLATYKHHQILLEVWQDTTHWVVGRYVLMPDHLHLFAGCQENAVEFDAWVQYFKSQFTKRNKCKECVWQTDHWDTRIRNANHYEEKALYMYNNPVRAGLVADAEDWKYKGSVHQVRWE